MSWLHKTNTGRVVYERRRHRFSGRDLIRVQRNFLEHADFDDIVETISQTTADALRSAGQAWGLEKAVLLFESLFSVITAWVATQAFDLGKQLLSRMYPAVKKLYDLFNSLLGIIIPKG